MDFGKTYYIVLALGTFIALMSMGIFSSIIGTVFIAYFSFLILLLAVQSIVEFRSKNYKTVATLVTLMLIFMVTIFSNLR